MPGQLMWGWDPTNGVWRPIVVNDEGKLIIDPSEVTLDKLGDVEVPTPTDGFIVYWDAATSLWKAKAIPPPLAHKTSHQDGGTDEISVTGLTGLLADAQTPLAHKTSHERGGADEMSLRSLWMRQHGGLYIKPWDSIDGWTEFFSGGLSTLRGNAILLQTGAVANQYRSVYSSAGWWWSAGTVHVAHLINPRIASANREIWLGLFNDPDDPANFGIEDTCAFKLNGTALYSVCADQSAAGTETTNLNYAITYNQLRLLEMIITPSSVKFYVEGLLKHECTNPAAIPDSNFLYFCAYIKTTEAVDKGLDMLQLHVLGPY